MSTIEKIQTGKSLVIIINTLFYLTLTRIIFNNKFECIDVFILKLAIFFKLNAIGFLFRKALHLVKMFVLFLEFYKPKYEQTANEPKSTKIIKIIANQAGIASKNGV